MPYDVVREPLPASDPSRDRLDVKLSEIKRHIIQLEAITLSTILFIALQLLLPTVERLLGATAAALFPFCFLVVIPWLAPVVNPEDGIRSRIKWGLSGLGAGGLLGGAGGTLIAGPIGTPIGALVGGGVGFITGFISGPAMDGRKRIFTQGEAREYLLERRKDYPQLTFEKIIAATIYPNEDKLLRPVRMFMSDGVIKCTKEDVDAWLGGGHWDMKVVT